MVGVIYLLAMSSVLLYNPDRKNKDEFIAEFVIRTKIFDEMWADIVSGKMKTPEQHYLLLGQRGAGKTTLLLRIKYAVEDDVKLSQWLIPVMFGEEQYNIGELGNLWERIAEYLEDYHGFKGITEEIEPFVLQDNYEEAALRVLIKHLDQHKKKIILLVDNIGQLLAKFSQLEVHRLREVLQTIPHFRLVAGSPVTLESVLDYQQPLFEFFKVIQLKGLTDEESIKLLRQLALVHHEEAKIERIIQESPSRITTLRTLSGGVPRTMALLFDVFVDNEHGNALSDLERVLDAVTPLYKHRMDDLPAQQQKIVDIVAMHWEPIPVKELSKQVRLDSKLVSAQLRQLEKNQVIEKRTTNTKNNLYLLRERFFNIWYLMRYGRKQNRNRVIWLVKFLEAWCDKGEIEQRVKNYIEKIKKGLLDKNTQDVYGLAYTFFANITPETKFLLKENTPEYISTNVTLKEPEFYKLLLSTLKENDSTTFIRIANSRNMADIEERDRFYEFLQKNFEEIEALFQKNRQVYGNHTLSAPSVYFALFFAKSHEIFVRHIILGKYKQNQSSELMMMVDVLLMQLSTSTVLSEFEASTLISIIVMLFAIGHNKVALKILEVANFDELQEVFWKQLDEYIRSGVSEKQSEDSLTFSKTMIEYINNMRKVLKDAQRDLELSKKG